MAITPQIQMHQPAERFHAESGHSEQEDPLNGNNNNDDTPNHLQQHQNIKTDNYSEHSSDEDSYDDDDDDDNPNNEDDDDDDAVGRLKRSNTDNNNRSESDDNESVRKGSQIQRGWNDGEGKNPAEQDFQASLQLMEKIFLHKRVLPIRLKILMDRLLSGFPRKTSTLMLVGLGWTTEEYARGYLNLVSHCIFLFDGPTTHPHSPPPPLPISCPPSDKDLRPLTKGLSGSVVEDLLMAFVSHTSNLDTVILSTTTTTTTNVVVVAVVSAVVFVEDDVNMHDDGFRGIIAFCFNTGLRVLLLRAKLSK